MNQESYWEDKAIVQYVNGASGRQRTTTTRENKGTTAQQGRNLHFVVQTYQPNGAVCSNLHVITA